MSTGARRPLNGNEASTAELFILTMTPIIGTAQAGRLILKGVIAGLRHRGLVVKITAWISALIFGKDAIPEVVEKIKRKLSNIIGEVVETLDYEGIKNAVGRALAKKLGDKLFVKYGIDCQIDNLASETIAEEFGAFAADVLNDKLSARLGREVFVISTFFPPDDVVSELDTFLTDEINLKLGLNVSSILLNNSLIDEIKKQVVDKIQQELVNNINQVKGKMYNDLSMQLNGADATRAADIRKELSAINAIFESGLAQFSAGNIFGFPINANIYYAKNKAKISNKMRQRKYRQTHIENRVWALR